MLKWFLCALSLFMVSNASADAAAKLAQLKRISNAGAPFLTLKMLDQAQPKLDADLYNWILWEQERYSILEQWEQWNELLIRIEGLPKDLPEPFKHQLATKQANAYLALGQTRTAREVIRPYLWAAEAGESLEYENWRKVVVNSYIKDERFDDARIAMRRFSQDFNSQDSAWLENRALILIQSNHLEEAAEILSINQDVGLEGLALYVDLVAKKKSARSILKEAKAKAKKVEIDTKADSVYKLVALQAAKKLTAVDKVLAYEAVLKTKKYYLNEILQVDPDELWQVYLGYADYVGNRAELLQGDDERWLKLAQNSTKLTPVKARSLFAHIMINGQSPKAIETAAQGYLSTLNLEKEKSKNLLNGLFNKNGRFTDVKNIPVSIRFELVDLALKHAEIIKATRLMSGLEKHPDNTDLFAWQLRRARVLVLGGQIVEGHQVMTQLLNAYTEPTTQKTDRVLQVLFDLQTIGANEQAIISFNKLLSLAIEPRQKREVLFWMADSYKALNEHHRAALLYLQSALYAGPNVMDPWAQTARFTAAESLAEAGLVDDARRIYNSLLAVTEKPSQKSAIRHKIQQLWLNQPR